MSNRLSLKLILLWALALMLPRAAMAMTAPDALWLNGSMYGANKWGLHNNTHPVRLTKDGDKFTARNVRFDNGDQICQFALYATSGWSDSKYYNLNDVELTDGSSVSIGYGTGDKLANFFLQAGTYDITVDFAAETVSVKKLDHYSAPDRLFLNGQIAGRDAWSLENDVHPIEFVRNGDVFTATNVPLDNAGGTEADFSLYTDPGWNDSAFRCYPTDDSEASAGSPKSFWVGNSGRNFKAKNGIYNITVDFAAGTLSLEEAGPFTAHDATFTMSFWEGPSTTRSEDPSSRPRTFPSNTTRPARPTVTAAASTASLSPTISPLTVLSARCISAAGSRSGNSPSTAPMSR